MLIQSCVQYKEKGDESGLHIIIFDELDAIFKQRGSTSGGTGVGDTVVNQILSKVRSLVFPSLVITWRSLNSDGWR
jgi:hypothetical protein